MISSKTDLTLWKSLVELLIFLIALGSSFFSCWSPVWLLGGCFIVLLLFLFLELGFTIFYSSSCPCCNFRAGWLQGSIVHQPVYFVSSKVNLPRSAPSYLASLSEHNKIIKYVKTSESSITYKSVNMVKLSDLVNLLSTAIVVIILMVVIQIWNLLDFFLFGKPVVKYLAQRQQNWTETILHMWWI